MKSHRAGTGTNWIWLTVALSLSAGGATAVLTLSSPQRQHAASKSGPAEPSVQEALRALLEEQNGERAGNIQFVRPAGWKRQDNPDGTVVLNPPDLIPASQAGVVFMHGHENDGRSLRTWFDLTWQAVLQANQARFVSAGEIQSRRSEGFEILSSTAVIQPAGRVPTYCTLFVAAAGTRIEAVLFAATSAALHQKYLGAVNALMTNVKFANLEAHTANVSPGAAATVPTAPRPAGLAVDSLYVSFARQEAYRDALGTIRLNFLVLYANGLAYKGGGAPLVQGPPAIDLTAPLMRYNLGKYKVVGDQVHLTMPSEATQVMRRHAEGLGEGGGPFSWRRVAAVDGLRLQGNYIDTPVDEISPRISFSPDGTFREMGVLGLVTLHYLERGLTAPAGGSGKYSIQDYTLTLRYDNGLVERMMFFIMPGEDPKRPAQIVINVDIFQLRE